jgi:steroid 5-alpha reductase family enzyme
MWKTILLLIITLIIVPIIAYQVDKPLSEIQNATLLKLVSIYLIVALLCFVLSSLLKNYSQVDKLWSILPIIYCWIVSYYGDFEPRLVLMSVLVSIWGLRLSYNFGRRGGYSLKFWSGEEDYRWKVLMAKPEFQGRWKWVAFNLFFISLYQLGLILLFTLPILKSMGGQPLFWADYLLTSVFLAFVLIETIADQQQWVYQEEKHRLLDNGKELTGIYKIGYTHTGFWGLVRHPNYAAEQAIWLVFYFFSVTATGYWINWSLVGALLLVLLFKGSSDFSEEITSSKYPDYKDYIKKTPRFIPFTKF